MAGLERQIKERQVISDTLFELGRYPQISGEELALAICPLREGLMINSQEALDLDSPLGRIQRTMDYLQTEVDLDNDPKNKLIKALTELRVDKLKVKEKTPQVDILKGVSVIIKENNPLSWHPLDWKFSIPNYTVIAFDLFMGGNYLVNGNSAGVGMLGIAAFVYIGPRIGIRHRQNNRMLLPG